MIFLRISITWPLFQIIQWCWIGLAIIIFFLLLGVTAPYGRHSSRQWGPVVSNRWGWLIMEFPVLAVLWYFLYPVLHTMSAVSLAMTGLFSFHYINRVFIYPFRIHTKGKKIPLVIVASAIFFNLVNGFSFGYFYSAFAEYDLTWFYDERFVGGTCIFIAGLYLNWKADNILIRLRKPGETGYKIPSGWLFEKISCPNLFGELIEWLGFAILCWNLPALTFLVWTAANLVPRAVSHHKWYLNHFENYPSARKAIIPYFL